MVVENVKGAQRWVGRAAWHFGSFYLWGDVPAVMPFALGRKSSTGSWDLTRENYTPDHSWDANSKGFGGSWFAQNHNRESGSAGNPVDGTGVKAPGNDTFKRTGQPCGKFTDPRYPSGGVKQHGSGAAWFDEALNERRRCGIKNGGAGTWFHGGSCANRTNPVRATGRTTARKAASAQIAKIPFELSNYLARVFHP